jgi:bifunctional non-homologous end joining protein LigD
MASKLPAAIERAFPGFIEPSLATLNAKIPAGAQWQHEIKYDGYRLQIHKSDNQCPLPYPARA